MSLLLNKRYLAFCLATVLSMPGFAFNSFVTKVLNQQRKFTISQTLPSFNEEDGEDVAVNSNPNPTAVSFLPDASYTGVQSSAPGGLMLHVEQLLTTTQPVTFNADEHGIIHTAGTAVQGSVETDEPDTCSVVSATSGAACNGTGENSGDLEIIWLIGFLSNQSAQFEFTAGQQITIPEMFGVNGPIFSVVNPVTFFPPSFDSESTTSLLLHLVETSNASQLITIHFIGNYQEAFLHAHTGHVEESANLPLVTVELSNDYAKKKHSKCDQLKVSRGGSGSPMSSPNHSPRSNRHARKNSQIIKMGNMGGVMIGNHLELWRYIISFIFLVQAVQQCS